MSVAKPNPTGLIDKRYTRKTTVLHKIHQGFYCILKFICRLDERIKNSLHIGVVWQILGKHLLPVNKVASRLATKFWKEVKKGLNELVWKQVRVRYDEMRSVRSYFDEPLIRQVVMASSYLQWTHGWWVLLSVRVVGMLNWSLSSSTFRLSVTSDYSLCNLSHIYWIDNKVTIAFRALTHAFKDVEED